jgi:CDP-paratose 2-epimerase
LSNIGGGPENTLSLLELVEALNQIFGRELHCSFDEWRPGDQPVFVSSIAKAKNDFGWQPSCRSAGRIEAADRMGQGK